MDFVKYENRGLTGLENMGNTCYVNSFLQILSHTYEFNNILSKNDGDYRCRLNPKIDSVLLHEWDVLRKMMWSENCIISPGGFISSMKKISKIKNMDLFSGFQQNDVSEFLLFILDCFHSALARPVEMKVRGIVHNEADLNAKACYDMMSSTFSKQYSEIIPLFYGVHVSIIESLNSTTLSRKPEPFCLLNISLPTSDEPVSLHSCLTTHCQPEFLSGENAWYNEVTNEKQNVKKRISFWSLPTILIIVLKRFEMNTHGHVNKIRNQIIVPCDNVDFSQYVHGYNSDSYVYQLFGICNHHGNSVMGGHYTATIRNANGKWYACNDTIVKEVPLNTTEIVSNLPYCLFYRKIK